MDKSFPFTSYDFYAYLASGLFFIFSLDVLYTNGQLLNQPTWNFIQIVIVVAISYMVGQILAIPSAAIFEHLVFGRIFRKPLALLIGSEKPRLREQILGKLVSRYYEPLPANTRERILINARRISGMSEQDLLKEPETIFQPAFVFARKDSDTCLRLDDFRNQYGFARNMCFTGLSLMLLTILVGSANDLFLAIFGVLSLGMFIRFVKFYAAFSAEVLRSFAFSSI